MVDVTPVQEMLFEVIPPIAALGLSVLSIAWLLQTFRQMREAMNYGIANGHGAGFAFLSQADQEDMRRGDEEYERWYERKFGDLNQAGHDAFHPEPTDNEKLHWSEDQWAAYIADQREDDDSARRQCRLEEFQDTVPDPAQAAAEAFFGKEPDWNGSNVLSGAADPADAEFAAFKAQQEAEEKARFDAMTPYQKYLAKATPEDLARDAELEAEIAAEDERIARKYGLGGTHQGEIKAPKLGSGWGA